MAQKLTGEPLSNGKYINPKLITWDSEIKTRFRGNSWRTVKDVGSCYETGVLKIGSVYHQGTNNHLQVFLKEFKYKERDDSFLTRLSDDEENEGFDTDVNDAG